MYAIYRINAKELNSDFLKSLKTMFKNKDIEIAICEASEVEEDETAYLLKSPANRDRLLKAIDNINNNRNLVTVDPADLK
jgi:antitoxin YefM